MDEVWLILLLVSSILDLRERTSRRKYAQLNFSTPLEAAEHCRGRLSTPSARSIYVHRRRRRCRRCRRRRNSLTVPVLFYFSTHSLSLFLSLSLTQLVEDSPSISATQAESFGLLSRPPLFALSHSICQTPAPHACTQRRQCRTLPPSTHSNLVAAAVASPASSYTLRFIIPRDPGTKGLYTARWRARGLVRECIGVRVSDFFLLVRMTRWLESPQRDTRLAVRIFKGYLQPPELYTRRHDKRGPVPE